MNYLQRYCFRLFTIAAVCQFIVLAPMPAISDESHPSEEFKHECEFLKTNIELVTSIIVNGTPRGTATAAAIKSFQLDNLIATYVRLCRD